MWWTCDKCGKKMEISTEQLSETEGVVVCPQCLGTDVVPGYKRRGHHTPSRSQSAPPTPPATDNPPPYRKRQQNTPSNRKTISFVEQPPKRPPHPTGATAADPPKTSPKKKKKKKKNNKGCLAPPSTWGCFWRSALYTAIFLTLYSALGFLLQCT